jgi:hypothetical protein
MENIAFLNMFHSVHYYMIVTNWTTKLHTLLCFNLQTSYNLRASLVHHQGVQLYKTIARPLHQLQYTEEW